MLVHRILMLYWKGGVEVVSVNQRLSGEQQWTEVCGRAESLTESLSGEDHYEAILGVDCVLKLEKNACANQC